jgi:hypothetical protein
MYEVHVAGEFSYDGLVSSYLLATFFDRQDAHDFAAKKQADNPVDIILVKKPELSMSKLGYPTVWDDEL